MSVEFVLSAPRQNRSFHLKLAHKMRVLLTITIVQSKAPISAVHVHTVLVATGTIRLTVTPEPLATPVHRPAVRYPSKRTRSVVQIRSAQPVDFPQHFGTHAFMLFGGFEAGQLHAASLAFDEGAMPIGSQLKSDDLRCDMEFMYENSLTVE